MKSTRTRLNVEDIPGTAHVPAGGNVLLSAEYEALSESASEGDIVATAVFTENMTGRQLTNETTLTAVKVELEADVTISEEARNRHIFGVAETVACRMTPSGVSGLSFNATKGTYSSASGKWTCPVVTNQVSGGLSVARSTETIYDFETTTTPPTGIVAEHGVGYDFSVPPGTAGGAGMQLELHVLPKTVSFSSLSLVEVPTTTEGPTGYFTNIEFSAVWYHTTARGAGVWRSINRIENYWFPDDAMMGDAFPSRQILEWAGGTIVWDIPIAWDLLAIDDADKTYDKRIPVLYKQRFDFNASGTLRVTKHGYWEERDPDDTKRASEGISTWIEPIIAPPQ